jgi:flagellar protein FlaF
MPPSQQNPYTKAAGAYGTTASATDPRALEGTILLKYAQKLEDIAKRLQANEKVPLEEVGGTLEYNQKLWQLFVEDMMNPDHPLPQEIKNNIASLALFVFKRTQEILIDTQPDKFKILININRNIAAGLMKKQPAAAAGTAPQAPNAGPMPTDSMA